MPRRVRDLERDLERRLDAELDVSRQRHADRAAVITAFVALGAPPATCAAPDLTASRVLPPREEQEGRRLEGKTPEVRARRNSDGAA